MNDNNVWLEVPIHMNYFKYEMSDDVKDKLLLSFDGSIMAVDFSLIKDFFESDESKMIRLGMSHIPKDFKVSSDETFKKFLSYQAYSD